PLRRLLAGSLHAKGSVTAVVVAIALLAAGCASSRAAAPDPTSSRGTPLPRSADPTPSPSPLPPVSPITPTLEATWTGGFSSAQVQAVQAVAGVAAAARVSLGDVTANTPGGLRQLLVAGVEPLEFRPLAPAVTAQADFVWQGLLGGQIYLAHEEQPVLGVALGSDLSLKGPLRSVSPRVGGLAANGVPNLASALVSLTEANQLGIPGPSVMVIGTAAGVNITAVSTAVQKALPGTTVTTIVPLVDKALITGAAAEKLLGAFTYTSNANGSINEDPAWVRANIVTRTVPILGSVTCNKLMFPQLIGALTELQDDGLAHLLNAPEYQSHPGNCWQPRYVNSIPSEGLSYHAWGIAIDLNRVQNPLGGPSTQDPRLISIFESWGFRWGGLWTPPDPMHFELAGIQQQ
ncbi:MAG: M15 family metallopeptidase, partial [Actinomycetota bacterium]